MVILGLILLLLGLFGIARALLVPLGAVLLTIGILVDLLAGVWHVGTAIF
jgi:hypothetical protein